MTRVAASKPKLHLPSTRRVWLLRLQSVLAAAVVATWVGQIDTHVSTDIADEGAARIQHLLNEMSTANQSDNKLS